MGLKFSKFHKNFMSSCHDRLLSVQDVRMSQILLASLISLYQTPESDIKILERGDHFKTL